MKEWMKRLFTAAVCIALIVSLVGIHTLKEEMEREIGYLQSQIQSLETQNSSIYREVDEMLEKEASLLSFKEWKISSIDVENETANIVFAITPKEYQEGMTEAFLQIGSQEYSMTMEDGIYRAGIEAALFENCKVDAVVLRDSTYTRTEHLDWNIYPRYDMLPDVYARFDGNWSSGSRGKDYITIACDGEIRVDIDSKGDMHEIQSVHLLEVLDGKVRERTKILVDENGMYTAECKEKYELPFGSRFELVAEVVDQYGLVYKSIAERWVSDDKGQPVDEIDWLGRGAAIYNQDGKLLFYE
ncbi:MAG: hypothetical protein IKU09_05820 [Firmicutes bacterium]|nr:hypothetical protein [Bacillota bacterium]